jgi:hypothetical protein
MMENSSFDYEVLNHESKIEEILTRAVALFQKTGLSDLAEKWEKILKTYISREELS